MSNNRIKVIGYAKKEFFVDGIEYRNFSPDLVGNQFEAGEGSPTFTLGNFNITTNIDNKVSKNFKTNPFSNFMCLENMNSDDAFESIITKYSKKAKLNLDYDDVLTYAFFGSLKEYIRVSLENIIIKWPASIYISKIDPTDTLNTGSTVSNYSYDSITNTSTFDINVNRIENPFEINYSLSGTIEGTFNETNSLRNLNLNFNYYEISNDNGIYPITGFSGSTNQSSGSIKVVTDGNPFPDSGSTIINYHIRPNKTKRESFFLDLNEFESKLLNRLTIPPYTSEFKVFTETDNGTMVESTRKITWPLRDGYNIDFNSVDYSRYVGKLIEIAENSDLNKSNLMVRFLVSDSISEFDSIPDISGVYQNSNGQKMTSALKIYGREFDEIKNISDGIKFANVVTYDKKNNTPDSILKNLARVLGWQLTTSISQIDVLNNFLSLNENYYDGYSRGVSNAEAEIELWRRLILNTPWLWKSKGTRKAIEFLFKFIGAPDGLVTFNEYLYVADSRVNIGLVTEMMEVFNNTSNISGLNVDSNGYPFVLPNNPDMYFQKAGLWYRQTGGPNADIDILEGNNPHIGPYDGGQEYMDQFGTCLVPNFSGRTGEEIDIDGEVNLFTNYDNGTFNECCDGNVFATVETDIDFSAITQNNIDDIINNFPVTETGCTFNNTWSITVRLNGEDIYENLSWFTGTANPVENDYINAIYPISGTTELSGITFNSNNGELDIIVSDDCDNELIRKYFQIELCVSTDYNCIEEGVGSGNITMFQVPTKNTNACINPGPQSLNQNLYHDGTGILPSYGDTIYTDPQGTTPYISNSGSTLPHKYLGGDISDVNNFLLTDNSGERVIIDCTGVCTLELSKSIGPNIGDGSFIVNGATQPTFATIRYTLENVIKDNVNDVVEVEFDNGVIISSDNNSIVVQVETINPESGNDFVNSFTSSITGNVTQYTVKFEALNSSGDCFVGGNVNVLEEITINI